MLRDRGSRHRRKPRGDLDDGKLPGPNEPQDLAPVGLGDRAQREVRTWTSYSRNGCGFPDSTNAFSRPTTCPQV
jgi:hypothetical protein